jgi:hypothetical protein
VQDGIAFEHLQKSHGTVIVPVMPLCSVHWYP